MAILSGTTIEGTLTLAKEGYIRLHSYSGTWLNGFQNAPIICPDAKDSSLYYPWIIQKNTSDNVMVTVGTYKNYFVIAGSTTSRTVNGYDNALFFNMSNGHLSLNNKYLYLHSNNYKDYAPTKTGSGASGTWGINISGTSKTITDILPVNKGGTSTTKFFRSGQIIYSSDLNSAIKHKGFCNFQCNTQVSTYTLGFDEKDINPNGAAGFEVHNKNNNMRIWTTGDSAPYYSGVYQVSPQKALIRISTSGVVEIKNTSDRRKKIYIEDTPENEVRTLLNIPIRNFIFKEDIKYNKLEQNGIFAQDLREAMKANNIGNRPYLQWEYNDNDRDDVYYDINSPEKDDMTYSVSYNHMVPALIKGWQMQNKEIEELEKKLAILRIKRLNK